MKKHLFLGLAMAAAVSAFPQASRKQLPVTDISVIMAKKFERLNRLESSTASPVSGQVIKQVDEPTTDVQANKTTNVGPVNWNNFTGSMNMYGYLLSESKPLQYDDELNAITFVHRKSATYVPSPVPTSVGANTGVLVAMVSQNWGTSWDSTMIYNDNTNWARYPQGGILKGPNLAPAFTQATATNTNIANAYIVATAPITPAAGGWIGNIFATKALGPGTYNNIQSQASQTFVSNAPPYTAWNGSPAKMDFVRSSFTSTDDGKVRAIGAITDGGSGTATRGGMVVTGSYISGSLVFTADSMIPPVRPNVLAGGRLLYYPMGMAWSEDGSTGYVWFIGAHTTLAGNNTGPNAGIQPIIARTIDFGGTWTWSSIDFSQSSFQPELAHLPGTYQDPNLKVPFFAFWEGISAVVDSSKNLHLVSMMIHSESGADPDSVNYTGKYLNYDQETYYWEHIPGRRPYIYDFHGGGPNSTGVYDIKLIDSLQTEGPGGDAADDGFGLNPWLNNTEGKLDIDSRIQVSRTINGRYILYSWAETDTNNTTNSNGFTKWNLFPNIKSRLLDSKINCLSKTDINVSKLPDAAGQTKMTKTSYNHYISQKCKEDLLASTTSDVVIVLPHTISFNPELNGINPATTRYASVPLEFLRPCFTIGVAENNIDALNSSIYPNPATNSAFLAIDLTSSTDVKVSVINVVGQVMKTTEVKGQVGANTISLDLNGLSKGIYLVNINTDDARGTKKLVIE